MSKEYDEIGVSEETAEWILQRQKRCVECNKTFQLEIHHRVSRGEGDSALTQFLSYMRDEYERSYERTFIRWHIHDIQNLVVLCRECHKRIDSDGKLREKYRMSFTCPYTGFNVPFIKSDAYIISR